MVEPVRGGFADSILAATGLKSGYPGFPGATASGLWVCLCEFISVIQVVNDIA